MFGTRPGLMCSQRDGGDVTGLPARRPIHIFVAHDHRDLSPPPQTPGEASQAATIAVPRIVQHTPRGRAWKVQAPIEPDPEADARVAAFLARMVRPRD